MTGLECRMRIRPDTPPSRLPPSIVRDARRRCDCAACGCGGLATHVYESGFCVCEDCVRCPVDLPSRSRLDDNLRGVFG